MARRSTREKFIEQAMLVHGNKYDYSLVEYINNRTKVKIICPTHGIFLISPAGHVPMKYGCIDCGGTRKRTTEEFIKKASEFHNNRYGYKKVVYKNTSTEIIIDCPVHGEIKQTPFEHMHSVGCSECGIFQRTITKINLGQVTPSILDKSAYEVYIQQIRRYTGRSYRDHKDKINPQNLQISHLNENHLDHIYSKVQGYHDKVPPEIIGHWTNLRIISGLYNITKNSKCDKTLEKLYEDYNLAERDK